MIPIRVVRIDDQVENQEENQAQKSQEQVGDQVEDVQGDEQSVDDNDDDYEVEVIATEQKRRVGRPLGARNKKKKVQVVPQGENIIADQQTPLVLQAPTQQLVAAKSKRKSNPLWSYCELIHEDKVLKQFKCKATSECQFTFHQAKKDGNTTLLNRHFESEHAELYFKAFPKKAQGDNTQTTLQGTMASFRSRANFYEEQRIKYITAFLYAVVHENLPLGIMSSKGLQLVHKQALKSFVPPSRTWTTTIGIPTMFNVCKQSVIRELDNSKRCVALTTDGWKSRGMESFQGLTASFVTEDASGHLEVQHRVLDLRHLQGRHLAVNLGVTLSYMFGEWGIKGTPSLPTPVTCDRGKDIDSALGKNEEVLRVSCYSHVVNRAVIATMSSDRFYAYGIMSKIVRLHAKFNQSDPLADAFAKYWKASGQPGKPLQLQIPVATRWHTYADCFGRYQQLHTTFQHFLASTYFSSELPALELCSDVDMHLLEVYQPLFNRLKMDNLILQKRDLATGCLTLEFIENLKEEIEEGTLLGGSATTDEFYKAEVSEASKTFLQELLKRYNEDRAFEITLLSYFNKGCSNVAPTWIDKKIRGKPNPATALIGRVFATIAFMADDLTPAPVQQGEASVAAASQAPPSKYQHLSTGSYTAQPKGGIQEEMSRYEKDHSIPPDCIEDKQFNPLRYWQAKKADYPRLFNVAKYMLAIPATSVPCESFFSIAGNIITTSRESLSAQTAKHLAVLKKNLTPAVVESVTYQDFKASVAKFNEKRQERAAFLHQAKQVTGTQEVEVVSVEVAPVDLLLHVDLEQSTYEDPQAPENAVVGTLEDVFTEVPVTTYEELDEYRRQTLVQ